MIRGKARFAMMGRQGSPLAPFYSHSGRHSIDPELMIRMLNIGYCFGIRSERRLCEEVHLNLANRWFCRLSLEDTVPRQRHVPLPRGSSAAQPVAGLPNRVSRLRFLDTVSTV